MTDGYQVYHTIEKKREGLRIAGCWSHTRRRFDEAVKTLPQSSQKNALAYLALKQIQAICKEENKLSDLVPEERLKHLQLTVKPLVDAYFVWIKQNMSKVPAKEKTYNGFCYSMNQEKYLRVFWKMERSRWITIRPNKPSAASVSEKRTGCAFS